MLIHPDQAGALLPFDKHANGAVGQLEKLQNLRDGADIVEIVALGMSQPLVELGDEQDVLVAGHRGFERGYRLVAADEQRNHLAGKHHQVAQGKQGKLIHEFIHPSEITSRSRKRSGARLAGNMGSRAAARNGAGRFAVDVSRGCGDFS